jgi:predicted DNA-binding mobile mystery protein A
MTTEERVRDVARRQLDQRLGQIREVTQVLEVPRGGWIAALRTAYGMSQKDLARRMGISQQAVSQLERREADGSATLHAIEQAAEVLGGQLVYAIVPARPIEALIEERALQMARQMTTSVRHTMRLEDQDPSVDLDDRTRALARELKASPERLWSSPFDE